MTRRRGPLVALIAAALVVVLSGAALVAARVGGSDEPGAADAGGQPPAPTPAPSTTPPPQTPDEITARLEVIKQRVAEARGLDFRREVPAEIQPEQELADQLLEEVDEETDEAELDGYARALELLGTLPAGTDLPQLLRDLQAESVLGYYLPGTDAAEGEGSLYVRGDAGLTPFVEWVLAHELTHAVTDQHFDLTYLEQLEEGGRDDEALAYSALVEGDATVLMTQYLQTQMDPEAQLAVAQEGMAQTTPQMDAAPAVIREGLTFPYTSGLAFVQALFTSGGWDAVDRAYAEPPTSTEQILHPEKYLDADRDEPQEVAAPDLPGALGGGWEQGVAVGFGEADIRWLLAEAEELSNTAAEGGADGWDGGTLATAERGDEVALVLQTVWDSAAEATEFCQTASRWATERLGEGTASGDGGTWNGQGQHAALVCDGTDAAWLSAPDADTLERLRTTR
jgi:hypothetical protein